jgi:hypothetical protein
MRGTMSGYQWAELLSGLAACLLGLLTLGIVLFAPLGSFASTTCSSDGRCTEVQGTESLAQSGIQPSAWPFLALLVVCLIVVAVSAALHSRWRRSGWRVLLWIATALIFAFVILASPSIGLFLAPAWLLALGAACLSLSSPSVDGPRMTTG